MMTSKVAFPAPPPTTNSLTSQQRAQRLRTTKKLEKILGSTPEWVDFADAAPSPNAPSRHFKTHSLPKRKTSRITKSTSLSSLSAMISPTSTLPPRNSKSPPPPKLSFWPKRPVLSQVPAPSAEAPTGVRNSFLSLAPLSPSPTSVHFHQPSNTHIPHSPNSSHEFTPTTTSFEIPVSRIRREKMDRVRRRLGHDVPVDMVFHTTICEEPAYANQTSFARASTPAPQLPPSDPIRRGRSYTTPVSLHHKAGISASRDSLMELANSPSGPHRAPRRSSTHPIILSSSTPYPPSPPPPKFNHAESNPSGNFLSLDDISEDGESELENDVVPIEEEVLDIYQRFSTQPLRASKVGRITAWANLVSESATSTPPPAQVQVLKAHRPPNNDSSEWFEDDDTLSDYELVFEGRAGDDSCSSDGPPSPRALTPSNVAECHLSKVGTELDLDDLISSDADAAYLLQYHGHQADSAHAHDTMRWDWGVPRGYPPVGIGKGTRKRMGMRQGEEEEDVGLEALALTGMMIY